MSNKELLVIWLKLVVIIMGVIGWTYAFIPCVTMLDLFLN